MTHTIHATPERLADYIKALEIAAAMSARDVDSNHFTGLANELKMVRTNAEYEAAGVYGCSSKG